MSKFTPEEIQKFEGLVPTTVEGSSMGSAYTVLARTSKGFVAVRRVASETFRVRCERFDGTPLADPAKIIDMLTLLSHGLKPGASHVSGIVCGAKSVYRMISLMTSLLLSQDFDPQQIPLQAEEGAQDWEDEHKKHCKDHGEGQPGELKEPPADADAEVKAGKSVN
jgi:hypothetical protein